MHTVKEYNTKDLNLAAFLIEGGHKLLRLEPIGRLKLFVFEAEAEEAVADYFNGAKVSARDFGNTLRDLKAQCNPR